MRCLSFPRATIATCIANVAVALFTNRLPVNTNRLLPRMNPRPDKRLGISQAPSSSKYEQYEELGMNTYLHTPEEALLKWHQLQKAKGTYDFDQAPPHLSEGDYSQPGVSVDDTTHALHMPLGEAGQAYHRSNYAGTFNKYHHPKNDGDGWYYDSRGRKIHPTSESNAWEKFENFYNALRANTHISKTEKISRDNALRTLRCCSITPREVVEDFDKLERDRLARSQQTRIATQRENTWRKFKNIELAHQAARQFRPRGTQATRHLDAGNPENNRQTTIAARAAQEVYDSPDHNLQIPRRDFSKSPIYAPTGTQASLDTLTNPFSSVVVEGSTNEALLDLSYQSPNDERHAQEAASQHGIPNSFGQASNPFDQGLHHFDEGGPNHQLSSAPSQGRRQERKANEQSRGLYRRRSFALHDILNTPSTAIQNSNKAASTPDDVKAYIDAWKSVKSAATAIIWPFLIEMLIGSNSTEVIGAAWSVYAHLIPTQWSIIGPFFYGLTCLPTLDKNATINNITGYVENTNLTIEDFVLNKILINIYSKAWSGAKNALDKSGCLQNLSALSSAINYHNISLPFDDIEEKNIGHFFNNWYRPVPSNQWAKSNISNNTSPFQKYESLNSLLINDFLERI